MGSPEGSRDGNNRALGPKYQNLNGMLGPKPLLFGSLDP